MPDVERHFTIASNSGAYQSAHPEDTARTIVYLFPYESLAAEHIAHADDPSMWHITEVMHNDLESWLESMLQAGYTDVYGSGGSLQDIRFWLTTLRAWRIGREIRGG